MSKRVTLKRDWSGSYYDVLLDGEVVVEHVFYSDAIQQAKTVELMLRVAEIVKVNPTVLVPAVGRKFR